ncbi:MAG: tRNA-dihydrouridine synthase family protein [Lachnospiraceae bacterium]|nr:tRNA-dihydrouridine synthase family protein [Lachnospiraceae bacterium]
MNLYLAPMEGITTRIYRDVFGKYYKGLAKCFTPFLSPNQNESFQKKELFEIENREEQTILTVPQILCCNIEHFLWAAVEVAKLGYKEVNFNLGCPSGTVVTKKKGSGFLLYPDELEAFFEIVFPEVKKLGLGFSIKTRLGKNEPDEFKRILDIYNKFDFTEIIIHPRVQKDFYKGEVRLEWFDYAIANSKNKVVYNGDLFMKEDLENFEKKYPDIDTVMLGRGLIGRPFLTEEDGVLPKDLNKLRAFHNELANSYKNRYDEHATLSKMKEIWDYMGKMLFVDESGYKRIKKAKSLEEYLFAAETVFCNMNI